MYLNKLHIIQFKNYLNTQVTFLPGFNLFSGLNGSGKTNLLDAIYYSAMTKSFFHNRDAQNTLHGKDFFRITAQFQSFNQSEKNDLVIKVQPGVAKSIFWNGKEYDQLLQHIGQVPMMMSAPSDIRIITDSSQIRRKYLNGFIGQMDQTYLESLMNYNRILRQRNVVLKKAPIDYTLLEVYTERMAPFARYIKEKRIEVVAQMRPLYHTFYTSFGEQHEISDIEYKSQLLEEDFLTLSKQAMRKDSITGRTSIGVHRDDIVFTLNEEPAKLFASQGQIKSILFSLHLAKHRILKEKGKHSPILLLDDIFAKLDDQRVGKLMRILKQPDFGQIFISDTSQSRLSTVFEKEEISEYKTFEIEAGRIKNEEK